MLDMAAGTFPAEAPPGRADWIGVLAKALPAEVETAFAGIDAPPAYAFLRRPEIGMVMVRGRAGGTGERFNLGEMTVTRCAVQVADGGIGYGYVAGRDKRHAELAAVLDAMLQDETRRDALIASVIEPLRTAQGDRRRTASTKAAATRVDFFTMVRGED